MEWLSILTAFICIFADKLVFLNVDFGANLVISFNGKGLFYRLRKLQKPPFNRLAILLDNKISYRDYRVWLLIKTHPKYISPVFTCIFTGELKIFHNNLSPKTL